MAIGEKAKKKEVENSQEKKKPCEFCVKTEEKERTGESGSLLSTVLGSGRSEDGSHLSEEGTLGPESTGLVEEGGNGGRHTTVTSSGTEDETVVLDEVVGSDFGVV
jgi:hypothetical protein